MSKHNEAYEAWKKLNEYCNEMNCQDCVFDHGAGCIWTGDAYTDEEIDKRIAELEQGEKCDS
ncbi:MAG: hypothetical protein IKE94_12625 [Aeriscardovia sp.]|nr:hypothetical protein [Aeriscardovia sp.]